MGHNRSGLKTILLVLLYMRLLPAIVGKELKDFVFAFEELENNIHPALQRRLLAYIREKVLETGCIVFMTTHSNVAIDFFSRDENAQIIHVTHDGKAAQARTVTTYLHKGAILDDLDVRASDLLQANGIIWVEGPSDRYYVNRWIELCSGGQLKEGVHYQCMFYGGSLLAHISASTPDDEGNGYVEVLKINRNAAVLIDSDKGDDQEAINSTKERILSEITKIGGLGWVTAGREIENYIPTCALKRLTDVDSPEPFGQFERMENYLEKVKTGEGKRFLSQKAVFAAKICPFIEKRALKGVYDLDDKVSELCHQIRKWNNLA